VMQPCSPLLAPGLTRIVAQSHHARSTEKMSKEMYRILKTVEQQEKTNRGEKWAGQKVVTDPADLLIEWGNTPDAVDSSSMHIVFCLDESGSMGGQPWNELISAVGKFWTTRSEEQGLREYVSVVQFSNRAHTTVEHVPLQGRVPNLLYHGGGTLFEPAVHQAKQLIDKWGGGQVAVIFMSDGSSGDSGAPSELSRIASQMGDKFSCYTVGFGGGADASVLKQMAFKQGKQCNDAYKSAQIGELGSAFGNIARDLGKDSPASQALVKEISDAIAQKVHNKICSEYL